MNKIKLKSEIISNKFEVILWQNTLTSYNAEVTDLSTGRLEDELTSINILGGLEAYSVLCRAYSNLERVA